MTMTEACMGVPWWQILTVLWRVTGTTWPWLTRSLTHFCARRQPAWNNLLAIGLLTHSHMLSKSRDHSMLWQQITLFAHWLLKTQGLLKKKHRLHIVDNTSLHTWMDHSSAVGSSSKETCEQSGQSGRRRRVFQRKLITKWLTLWLIRFSDFNLELNKKIWFFLSISRWVGRVSN